MQAENENLKAILNKRDAEVTDLQAKFVDINTMKQEIDKLKTLIGSAAANK
jgi:hypothetical protein